MDGRDDERSSDEDDVSDITTGEIRYGDDDSDEVSLGEPDEDEWLVNCEIQRPGTSKWPDGDHPTRNDRSMVSDGSTGTGGARVVGAKLRRNLASATAQQQRRSITRTARVRFDIERGKLSLEVTYRFVASTALEFQSKLLPYG